MKKIPLSQGKVALVDDEDYEWLIQQGKWSYNRKKGYAFHKKGRTIAYMHAEIVNTPVGMDTDHIDGNGLNNQRSNLRVCTHSQNHANVNKTRRNKSGFKGVFIEIRQQKIMWSAGITVNRKSISLGTYPSPEAAARAYDNAARQYFGEFAKTNF